MNDTSANGSDLDAIGLTSSTFAVFALFAEPPVDLAVETDDVLLVVEDDDVDLEPVAEDFVPLLVAELAALCAVRLAELTSFCKVFVAPVNSPLTPAISLSTWLRSSRTLTPASRSNSP